MKLPLTVRLMFHALRAALAGGAILLAGWIAFVPATASEATALGAGPFERQPEGLRLMRSAKVITAIAPDRAYDLAARAAGPEVSGWMIRLVVAQVAAGNIPRLPEDTANSPADSDRSIDGPRFIQVD